MLDKIHEDQNKPDTPLYGHMRVIQPLDVQAKQKKNAQSKAAKLAAEAANKKAKNQAKTAAEKPAPTVTPKPDPAILELANNNDRDVASLAREANAKLKKDQPNEVIIKLR